MSCPPRRGIMRTEVVVVCCLAVLLACLLIPLVSQSRNTSDKMVVKDRLRQMGLQVHTYHDRYRSFPVMPGPVPAAKPAQPARAPENKLP
ncbi:MAG TPA: hypothetical protein VMM56_08115 [Planctomycetaceae bacterium]|nr:hypothetical protein [Planctomycetaceae bacterium]